MNEDTITAEEPATAAMTVAQGGGRSRRFWFGMLVMLAFLAPLPWLAFASVWWNWARWYQEPPWTNDLIRVDFIYRGYLGLLVGVVLTVTVLLIPRSRTPVETRRLRLAVRLFAVATFTSWVLAIALTSVIPTSLI